MNITKTIEHAEHKWLSDVYGFCRNCFSTLYLPSHDETHHLRVWHFAKTLIPGYHEVIHPLTRAHIEGILLAAMLHDTGMSQTFDITHGLASRRLTEKFFRGSSYAPKLADDILTAVEKHDDKSYSSNSIPVTDEGVILSVLSLADDMDAFGFNGVFRYYEIYSLRKFKIREMANAVLSNLDRRFETMAWRLDPLPDMLSDIRNRYRSTRRFFEDLQAGNPCAVEILNTFEIAIRKPGRPPGQAIPEILEENRDPCLSSFLKIMYRELSSTPLLS